MLLEDQRMLHEDLERLEQAIADRVSEDPKVIRDKISRDHQVAQFLDSIQSQSQRLLEIYEKKGDDRTKEIQAISTGDTFKEFYKQLDEIKRFHSRYPNQPAENLERVYKRRPNEDAMFTEMHIDSMFTGEEAYGRFLDLVDLHVQYTNLKGIKGGHHVSYTHYLDIFDKFTPPECPLTREQKLTPEYLAYVASLDKYLESFLRRTRPLEDLDKLFRAIEDDFEKAWQNDEIAGWSKKGEQQAQPQPAAPSTAEGNGTGYWCKICQKEMTNENTYKSHLQSKKHKRNESEQANGTQPRSNGTAAQQPVYTAAERLKHRARAYHEYRIARVASTLQSIRADTRANVERKIGMTDKERQQEIQALLSADVAASNAAAAAGGDGSDDEDGDEKIYNPLKLPLAWDGKPIPFWLYKLHGLGVEFPCEICGNYVYMGRRAFDKHFTEQRHVYGLRCLGITNTTLFREITKIEEAVRLWEKIQREKREEKRREDDTVEMEDAEGNVMPEKVYRDLVKQGLL